jgi:AcrR family transcriptional regulator
MHSVNESADSRSRAERRHRTLHRITLTAQRLVDERGLDGFTMDELAEAVDVSRRTLFNYYPSKVDAVLGPDPDLDDQVFATFVAGGPHGDLVEDLIVLSAHVLESKTLTREELALGRRVMLAEPRLLAAVHERLATVSAELGALLVARSGEKVDLATAQLLVRVLAATFDCGMERTLETEDVAPDSLPQVVADNIRALRDLFSGTFDTT